MIRFMTVALALALAGLLAAPAAEAAAKDKVKHTSRKLNGAAVDTYA